MDQVKYHFVEILVCVGEVHHQVVLLVTLGHEVLLGQDSVAHPDHNLFTRPGPEAWLELDFSFTN